MSGQESAPDGQLVQDLRALLDASARLSQALAADDRLAAKARQLAQEARDAPSVRLLCRSLKESLRLGKGTEGVDEACRIAARAAMILRPTHPALSEGFNGLLHLLTGVTHAPSHHADEANGRI